MAGNDGDSVICYCKSNMMTLTLWQAVACGIFTPFGPVPLSLSDLYRFLSFSARTCPAFSAGRVHLWDVGAGRGLACWQAHESGILGLALSPDGRLIATACYVDGDVRLWDASGGGPRGALKFPTGVAALAF